MEKLNLGCGNQRMKGFVNVDNNPNCNPDVFHDLNIFPYPFKKDTFDEIYLDHVLEHLDDPIKVLEEIFRIAKNKAKITIRSPHFSCGWLHPGHRSAISLYLFNYFDQFSQERYGNVCFSINRIKLYWMRSRRDALEKRSILVKGINKIINFFANIYPGFTQRIWCYWVGGFEEIVFEATVIK